MPQRQVTIFSETDKYGIITFVNDDFCNISRYSMEELIGSPHDIIRHPEMPFKLFEILWRTIQGGQVFRGIIKNKAKDQTDYWVRATIMPVVDDKKEVLRFTGVSHVIKDHTEALQLYMEQAHFLSL